jgi:hypothetical protein
MEDDQQISKKEDNHNFFENGRQPYINNATKNN